MVRKSWVCGNCGSDMILYAKKRFVNGKLRVRCLECGKVTVAEELYFSPTYKCWRPVSLLYARSYL